MKVDYLIVGSGLTGAVVARTLADAGREVLVVDRRDHLGGNVHDHRHKSGIRIHTYGPHYFRTSSDRIWEFATRFGEFFRYEPALLSAVDGRLEQWPIAASYIRRTLGEQWSPEFRGQPSNLEEAALSLMPRAIYQRFVKQYNEKQWGVPCTALAPQLCTRFDVRTDDEPRLKPDARHQGIPAEGYAAWMGKMLEGVSVQLGVDYHPLRADFVAKRMLVYTGPIDEYFGFDLGRLAYRGQQRRHTFVPRVAGCLQPCGQVNNPQHAGGPHIRTLEWKHMMPAAETAGILGTILTTETPFSPQHSSDFEYPFPDAANAALYEQYRRRADALDNALICGRLGEYRYYDMDQAIGRALVLAERLLEDKRAAA